MTAAIYGNLITAMAVLALSAIIAIFVGNRPKLAGWLNFAFVTIAAVIILNISYAVAFQSGESLFDLGCIGLAGLFNAEGAISLGGGKSLFFLVDGFAAFFLAIIAFMSVMSAFYSIRYMEHYHDYSVRSYYVNFPIFILGMAGIVTVDDLSVGFSVAWQLMTITSFLLVRFEYRKPEIVKSATKYLILMEVAWVLILAGAFVIQGAAPFDSVHQLTLKLSALKGAMPFVVYGLIFLGFGFKAAVFPLGQLWLPDAHSIAPSPISALLSGVMIKTGIYGIIRTFFWMIPHGEGVHFDGIFWGVVIATFGVATLFIGTVQSMKQSDSKRLLAYSSIGQIGYIIFATGAALLMLHVNDPFVNVLALIAIVGAIYHVLNHAVFKGLLFLTSGSVLYATGTKDLNKLGGLMKIMPVSALVAGIAALSISGVPPFSGFASKWTIISSTLLAGKQMFVLVVFGIIALFTSAVTLSCYVKFFGMTFTSAGHEWNTGKEVKEVPGTMLLPKVILAVLCVVQGLFPFAYFTAIINIFETSRGSILHEAFNKIDLPSFMNGGMMGVSMSGLQGVVSSAVPVVVLLVIAAALALGWLLKNSAGSTERAAATWLCGYQDLHDANRYHDRNMYAALRGLLRWTGGNPKK